MSTGNLSLDGANLRPATSHHYPGEGQVTGSSQVSHSNITYNLIIDLEFIVIIDLEFIVTVIIELEFFLIVVIDLDYIIIEVNIIIEFVLIVPPPPCCPRWTTWTSSWPDWTTGSGSSAGRRRRTQRRSKWMLQRKMKKLRVWIRLKRKVQRPTRVRPTGR